MATPDKRFSEVYRRKLWAERGVLSGPGSQERTTRDLRDWLGEQAAEGMRTVLDLGCGDLEWVSHCAAVTEGELSYYGVDVVGPLIAHHRRVFPWFRGEARDLEAMPRIDADIVLLKDVLFHLCNGAAQQILMNVAAGRWRRLVTTTERGYNNAGRRGLKSGGAFVPLDVEALGVLTEKPAFYLARPGGGSYAVFERPEARDQRQEVESDQDAWEILVPTHAGAGTPHLAALLASNPCARVHVVHLGKEEPAGAPAWRGNDAALRAWWRENRGKITGRRVAWLEYDVLVTQELPDVWPEGVLAKELKGAGWRWWGECERLPEFRRHWCGVAPLGVSFWNAAALDAIADAKYDEVFARDVFCELRMPTICRAAGFPVQAMSLPGVRWYPVSPRAAPGIYHAVKH
jgi:hypothetical protein